MTEASIAGLSLEVLACVHAVGHSIWHSCVHGLITVMINRVQTLLHGVLVGTIILSVHVEMVWLVVHDSLAAAYGGHVVPVGIVHAGVEAVLVLHIHGGSLHLRLHLLLLGVVLVRVSIVNDDAFLEVLTCILHLMAKVLLLWIHVTAHGSTKILLLLLLSHSHVYIIAQRNRKGILAHPSIRLIVGLVLILGPAWRSHPVSSIHHLAIVGLIIAILIAATVHGGCNVLSTIHPHVVPVSMDAW